MPPAPHSMPAAASPTPLAWRVSAARRRSGASFSTTSASARRPTGIGSAPHPGTENDSPATSYQPRRPQQVTQPDAVQHLRPEPVEDREPDVGAVAGGV